MIIRSDQIEAFEQAVRQRFADRMVEQLKSNFPRRSIMLGDEGLRAVVGHGIGQSSNYGIVRERDVGRYIAVMMMYGPYFDEHKASGSLYTVLRNPRFISSQARTEALCRSALAKLKAWTTATGRKPLW